MSPVVCPDCGAHVGDWSLHRRWHVAQTEAVMHLRRQIGTFIKNMAELVDAVTKVESEK